jgi:hypothetical protein
MHYQIYIFSYVVLIKVIFPVVCILLCCSDLLIPSIIYKPVFETDVTKF